MVCAISFFLRLFCPCNNHANKICHNLPCLSLAKTMPIKFVITSKRLCHATESQHVKYGGVAKLTESILKGLTAPTRSVHSARAMIAYLDHLRSLTGPFRAPYKIRHPISKNHAKTILHNLGSYVCNNHANKTYHNLIARFRKSLIHSAE